MTALPAAPPAPTAVAAPLFAEQLTGASLTGGWTVGPRITKAAGATGGHFSVGYRVVGPGGREAFLKALDFSGAIASADPTRELQALTEAYNFERDLLVQCRDRRLSRVVLALAEGSVRVDPTNPFSTVPYIIFELADGDIRTQINFAQRFDLAWALRTLHHVAVGLTQLHSRQIAHQDLKPSNVMTFEHGTSSKIGDLGRAAQRGATPPHEHYVRPGDRTYAPPEQLYEEVPTDWAARRMGCDAYQLGSMAVFLFTGLSMTSLWRRELPPGRGYLEWTGTFKDVLPFVRDAFDRAVGEFEKQVPEEFRTDLTTMVRRLCDPDPDVRGHPRARAVKHGNPFDLARFVTELELLARRAERSLRPQGL